MQWHQVHYLYIQLLATSQLIECELLDGGINVFKAVLFSAPILLMGGENILITKFICTNIDVPN